MAEYIAADYRAGLVGGYLSLDGFRNELRVHWFVKCQDERTQKYRPFECADHGDVSLGRLCQFVSETHEFGLVERQNMKAAGVADQPDLRGPASRRGNMAHMASADIARFEIADLGGLCRIAEIDYPEARPHEVEQAKACVARAVYIAEMQRRGARIGDDAAGAAGGRTGRRAIFRAVHRQAEFAGDESLWHRPNRARRRSAVTPAARFPAWSARWPLKHRGWPVLQYLTPDNPPTSERHKL
jgi:hypothetical protein